MSAKEMATAVCQQDDAAVVTEVVNDSTLVSVDQDVLSDMFTPAVDDKDCGGLSEPEELRRSSKRTRTRRSLLFKDKSVSAETEQMLADPLSDGKDSTPSGIMSEDRKKQRSLWTVPETQAFFEALAEHGKDFQAIQLFIQNKLSPDSSKKNKAGTAAKQVSLSAPVSSSSTASSTVLLIGQQPAAPLTPVYEVRSREQVRHFYYRTWHKISGTCQFDDVLKSWSSGEAAVVSEDAEQTCSQPVKKVDKAVLELYGLINYGEVWKKFPSKWDSRIKSHLKELILEGSTVIKTGSKVKAIKIKTPICKALKRINGLLDEDSSQSSNPLVQQMPDDVVVQLLPKNNDAFLRVQSIAKNPRILCRVCLQKKISSLALFLEQYKWNSERTRKSIVDSEFQVDPIEDLSLDSKTYVKLSVHRSQLEYLDPLHSGVTISHPSVVQPVDANVQSVVSMAHSSSSLSMSFRNYLTNAERRKGASKSGPKYTRKEKMTATPNASLVTPSRESQFDTTPAKVVPAATSITVEIEDSCSSSSSVTPFRDAVKKLTLLNQALGTTVSEADDCAVSDVANAADAPTHKKDVPESIDSDVVSSSLRDDCEVSLPPPTATLAQWLSSRDSDVPVADFSQDDSVHDGEKSHESPTTTVEDRVCLDMDTMREGWTSEETSITFAELYLLLKSPARITLTYSFLDPEVHENKVARDSEERYFRDINCEETSPKAGISLLDKLLTAASISISLHRKLHVSNTNAGFLPATTSTSNNLTCSSSQQTPSTLRPVVSVTNRSPTNGNKKQTQQPTPQSLPAQTPLSVIDSNPLLTHHNFLMPTGPAPKAAAHAASPAVSHPLVSTYATGADVGTNGGNASPRVNLSSNISSVSNNKRQRIICEDPQVVEEAIKQLNQNRFVPKKRQRVIRPITVGPVSGKVLIPRPTIQMMTGSPAPTAQIQILSAPAPVSGPVPESATSTPPGLSLPICFTPNAVSVPTILIPTVIATNMSAPVPAAGTSSDMTSAPLAQTAAVTTSLPAIADQQMCAPLDQDLPIVTSEPEKKSEVLVTSANELTLNQSSNQSLPCLSSLLELSLPEATTPVTSTAASLSHSFFNDNSCSSISEFISFGNPNLGQTALSSSQGSSSGLQSAVRDGKSSAQTPNWLLNEGSNSSSLGLSSLIFSTNELL